MPFQNSKKILVLDAGTTGVKALIFDEDKNIIARSYKRIQKTTQGVLVEQDPKEILKVSEEVIREAVNSSGLSPGDIKGLSITNQRETFVLWDKETGEPIGPAIVWEDTRTADFCNKAKEKYEDIVRYKTGLNIDPYFTASKLRWSFINNPLANKLNSEGKLLFGTIDTWLLWSLGSGHPHFTDYSNASRTLLFNIHDLRWDQELLELFGIPERILPRAVPSTHDFGLTNASIFGFEIPIVALCGDQQSSMFAAGRNPGDTKATFGTGTFIMQILNDFELQEDFFTTLTPGIGGRTLFALEAKIDLGGKNVDPLIGHEEEMNSFLRILSKKVSSVLLRLPHRPDKLVVDGGITQAKNLDSILQEEIGIKVIKQDIFDGTALGAALLAEAKEYN